MTWARWLFSLMAGGAVIVIALLPPTAGRFESTFAPWLMFWSFAGDMPLATSPSELRLEAVNRQLYELTTVARLIGWEDSAYRALVRSEGSRWGGPRVEDWSGLTDAKRHALVVRLEAAWRSVPAGGRPLPVIVLILPVKLARIDSFDIAIPAVTLLPDAPDRHRCTVVVERGVQVSSDNFEYLPKVLGACAYYSAFGAPGAHISRWYARRQLDAPQGYDWSGVASPESGDGPTDYWWHGLERIFYPNRRMSVAASAGALVCLAGDARQCARSVLEEPAPSEGHVLLDAGIVRSSELTSGRPKAFSQDWDTFLPDLVAEMGHDRFREFWQSDLPVEQAFQRAFGTTIGEWTLRWGKRHYGAVRLGPRLSREAVTLACVLVLIALSAATLATQRRQVA